MSNPTGILISDTVVNILPNNNTLLLGQPQNNENTIERYPASSILSLVSTIAGTNYQVIFATGIDIILNSGSYLIKCTVPTNLLFNKSSGDVFNIINDSDSTSYLVINNLIIDGVLQSLQIGISPGQLLSLVWVNDSYGFKSIFTDCFLNNKIIINNLAINATLIGTIKLKQTCNIRRYLFNLPSRLRLYSSNSKATADLNRPIGIAPSGFHGMYAEIITDIPNLDIIAYIHSSITTTADGILFYSIQNNSTQNYTISDPLIITLQYS
jgi:hypothetical protein